MMIKIPKPTLEQFFRTFSIRDFAVSPDEKQLVFSTNINGSYNLWAIDLATSHYPYPLTSKNQTSQFIEFLPNGSLILTGFDQDGDENWQINALSPEGGDVSSVLAQDREKFYFGDVSADSRYIYYHTSVGNQRFHNLARLNITTGQTEILLEGREGPLFFSEVSPSEESYCYIHSLGNTKDLGYVQFEGKQILVTPDGEKNHRVRDMKYWDDTTLYMLTNYESEFTYLARFDLLTQNFEKITSVSGYECKSFALDKQNKRIYLVAERGVQDKLCAYQVDSRQTEELVSPTAVIAKIRVADSGNIYLSGISPTQPSNIYKSRNGYLWQQITHHRVMGVDKGILSEPEVVTYSSFDGEEIEALYLAPHKDVDNGHTVLIPHGGPQGAVRRLFQPLWQYLAYLGYRVFAPNFRGSSGYGESFMNAVNKDWGGGPRLDIIAGMEWLNQQGKSEPGKWFCIGGSYGGYMTLLLHGRHADLFKAFVDQFGPSNLFTTIETAPEHWKAADAELIGDAEKDKDKLIEDSPITYLDAMNKPMLVVQGVNDPRVVKIESDVIVESLRAKGQDVEYLVLADEGHGYSKTENAIKVYSTIVDFLAKYL